jgi:DNA replication and repair protein RecF
MKLEKLNLHGFRNHNRTEFACSKTVNLFVGRNGQGKTNILEAIAYLSIGKSFFSAPDTNLVRRGSEGFVIHGSFRSDSNIPYSVGIRYTEGEGNRRKEIRINNKEEDRVSALIGKFPVVILYPEQHAITNGGPGERRRFMDLVLSQSHSRYFEMLTEYRRILRQRNTIFTEIRGPAQRVRELLAPWDEQFLNYAIEITAFRKTFVKEIEKYLKENYASIVGEEEQPSLKYESVVPPEIFSGDAFDRNAVRKAFEASFASEIRYGTTVFGPHRDELILLINGMEVRQYASQGQQKSFLVALKISESQYLLEKRKEQPLILLDDLFGELDRERAGQVLNLTTGMGQTFVTSADETIGSTHYTSLNGHAEFVIQDGKIVNV